MNSFSVTGQLVDVHKQKIYLAEVVVENGKIISIKELSPSSKLKTQNYILPGFIDSHVHIESSMLVPSEFARLAVVHGTVATVSDPHEIANVCGMKGVEFMIENGKTVPFKFNFGAPSCVPATIFETAGAALNADDVERLLQRDEIKYLSEMMNFPGVLNEDPEVMKKIAAAHKLRKPVDGHAPGLKREQAKRYIQASPNPSKGGASESDNTISQYNYHTAEPHVYGLLKKFVKEHRDNPTQAENVLWHLLRGRKLDGYKFRRQHIIGPYIADFVCLNKRLIIEVDGLIHHIPENKISDAERTLELNKLGFTVIRFTNEEVCNMPEKVLPAILLGLNKTTSITSEAEIPPLGGGGAVISTDHECFTKEEALDKLQYGMKILIREGSAAKNFEALIDLLHDYPDMIMFCSDDKHPDSLVEGHINQLCARAVAKGIDIFKVLKAACINPVYHYKLDVGILREGDDADFIIVKDLKNFEVIQTYINGGLVAENGKSKIITGKSGVINNFSCTNKREADFTTPVTTDASQLTNVIEALDGQLITNKTTTNLPTVNGQLTTDMENDVLKIVVVNRYKDASVAKAFIKNFGLKQGAIASSVAHDSHNIVAVGVDDESICKAVNMIIDHKGGVSCCSPSFGGSWRELIVPLPVAGLMSNDDGYKVAQQYSLIDKAAKEAGSTLTSPFMTLSFMALLVIPHLKLSDLGLFDGDKFEFV
ncbi:MAG: adenine deaminase C-terminal domain-containing protein [Bacteroidota bacterium]